MKPVSIYAQYRFRMISNRSVFKVITSLALCNVQAVSGVLDLQKDDLNQNTFLMLIIPCASASEEKRNAANQVCVVGQTFLWLIWDAETAMIV